MRKSISSTAKYRRAYRKFLVYWILFEVKNYFVLSAYFFRRDTFGCHIRSLIHLFLTVKRFRRNCPTFFHRILHTNEYWQRQIVRQSSIRNMNYRINCNTRWLLVSCNIRIYEKKNTSRHEHSEHAVIMENYLLNYLCINLWLHLMEFDIMILKLLICSIVIIFIFRHLFLVLIKASGT